MNLEKIVWPVFRLSEREPQRENGVIYYATEYTDLDSNQSTGTLRIVDDTNIDKPTLSRRRLVLQCRVCNYFQFVKPSTS